MSVMAMGAAILCSLMAAMAMGATTNHKRSKDTYEAINYMRNHHDWIEYRPCSVEEIENRLTKFSLHRQVSADDVIKMLSKVYSNDLT